MLSLQSAPPTTAPAPRTGLLARVGSQVRQVICGLHGHDSLLHFEPHRVSLQCTSCGHQSPGWDVTPAAPREPQAAAAPQSRVVRMPLVEERRVA